MGFTWILTRTGVYNPHAFVANRFHPQMLHYFAKQSNMWECNLKKAQSVNFPVWVEIWCWWWWWCEEAARSEVIKALAGCQCCLELEKKVQGRLRENSEGGKKNREGNLPFYFLQKLSKIFFWLLVRRIEFVGFGEEEHGTEVATQRWEQPWGKNRAKPQLP